MMNATSEIGDACNTDKDHTALPVMCTRVTWILPLTRRQSLHLLTEYVVACAIKVQRSAHDAGLGPALQEHF